MLSLRDITLANSLVMVDVVNDVGGDNGESCLKFHILKFKVPTSAHILLIGHPIDTNMVPL